MLRIVLGMIIGAAAGSGLTYYLVADQGPGTSNFALPAEALDDAPRIADGATLAESPDLPPPGVLDAAAPARTGGALAPDRPPADRAGEATRVDDASTARMPAMLDAALAIANPNERRRDLMMLAVRAARDPAGGFAMARRIANDQDRLMFLSGFVRELARVDPDFLLENFEQLDDQEARAIAVQTLASEPLVSIEPQRLLALAEDLDGQMSMFARQTALQRWAETDPVAAIAYAEALPLGQVREQALAGALGSYARKYPEAALAWLEAQPRPSPQAQNAVYAGIAQVDPTRAIDLLLESGLLEGPSPLQMQTIMPLVATLAHSAGAERTRIADRLLAGGRNNRYLQTFLSAWSSNAPEDAIGWLARSGASLDAAVYEQMAVILAQNNPELAASFTNQVPATARDPWIVGVAQGYAQRDAEAAIAWLDQYAGQAAHRLATVGVAQAIARYDPSRAAELLTRGHLDDPRAAGAASMVTLMWAQSDPGAARAWITGLPRGATRDGALAALVRSGGGVIPDPGTLALFSSDQRREQALAGAIAQVAATDAVRARELLAEHISDPDILRRAEQMIENGVLAPTSFGIAVDANGPVIRSSN